MREKKNREEKVDTLVLNCGCSYAINLIAK